MKIRYVRNQRKICPNIITIYKLVLEEGYKVERVYKSHPDYDDVVFLKLTKGRWDSREIILYPPDRVITRKGHGSI